MHAGDTNAAPPSPQEVAREARRAFAIELAARCCAVVVLGIFAVIAFRAARRRHDLISILQLIDGALNVFFIVAARFPKAVDRRPHAVLLAVLTTFAGPLVDYVHGRALVPRIVSYALQAGGISFEVFAKISLGRSFGIVPANRGVQTRGAYKLVRHPMYLGYAIAHLGVLLAVASVRNAIVIGAVYVLLVSRVILEERVLQGDESYRELKSRVRWRILPFIY